MINEYLRHQIGVDFLRFRNGWSVGLKLYWVAVRFNRRWHPHLYRSDGPAPWTGFGFYWKPNPDLKEGALIWLNEKLWMWPS